MQILDKPTTLGAALTKRRLQLAISLREAAQQTGVMTYMQFSSMEKDKSFNPTYVVMVGLCRFLGCDLNTVGRYVAASQITAGTITTGNSGAELKSKSRTDARRNTFFNVLYPVESK